jgi:hypothetical protein
LIVTNMETTDPHKQFKAPLEHELEVFDLVDARICSNDPKIAETRC